MKKLFYVGIMFLFLPLFIAAQPEKVIPSTVKKVIVYPAGAQLESEVTFPIQKGPMRIKLPGLTTTLNEESIRIISDGSFTILNVQYSIDYLNDLDKGAETQKLVDQIDDLKNKVEDEQLALKIIREKIDFLNVNRQITGKTEGVNAETFKTMNQIYGTNYETLNLEVLKRERKIQEYNETLIKLNAQLETVSNHTGIPSGTIVVTIDGEQAKTAKMRFSFFSWAASWSPTYDIRFTGFNKPLEITYFANIRQFTGIDWNNVELSLSTAKTQVSAQIPFLNPYYLAYQDNVIEVAYDFESDVSTFMWDTLRLKTGGIPESYSYTPTLTDFTSSTETIKEYKVENPQSIPSSTNFTSVTYGEGLLNASYDYRSIPKLSENVFLIAQISDWGDAELNTGLAKLYLENSYVGKSNINTSHFTDTLDISFGVDNNVTVKREKVTTYSEKVFAGSTIKETVGYKITIRNNKSYAITTSVFDQIPISVDENIKVEMLEISEGQFDKESGKVVWKLDLKPNETKTVILKYSVKYPKDKQVKVQ
ncbi:MAG: hypothetical protein H6Q25_226 [Bacteroidetes bacterium]|nr:hypothetical protein [Bacteroidota bacterium]